MVLACTLCNAQRIDTIKVAILCDTIQVMQESEPSHSHLIAGFEVRRYLLQSNKVAIISDNFQTPQESKVSHANYVLCYGIRHWIIESEIEAMKWDKGYYTHLAYLTKDKHELPLNWKVVMSVKRK